MKGDWDRHIVRPKHINSVNWKSEETKKLVKTYICDCGNKFKTNSGLWKHRKLCDNHMYLKKDPPPSVNDKELIMMLVKQNTELLEVIKNGTNNTTISNNTNSLNKTFNLQFFLHLFTF